MNRIVLGALIGLVCLGGSASSARADLIYKATGIYDGGGLLLPGFWGYDATSKFSFNDVKFTTTATGATLTGLVQAIASNGNGWYYNLNVKFTKVTDPSGIINYNPNWDYYMIQPMGKELVNVGNPNDYVNLFSYPSDGSKPFQVGIGANEWNGNFGAAGWLSWEHFFEGVLYTNPPDKYGDFGMDLELVPEPSTLALALTGLAGFGLAVRRRMVRRDSPLSEANAV